VVVAAAEEGLQRIAPVGSGDLLVVAFSGGPDSTALLLALAHLAPRRGWRLLAGHVDHRLDPGSGSRAAAATSLATKLGVPCEVLDAGPALRRPGRTGAGPEDAARRVRYELLEELRQRHGGAWLLTAHHADDQAETVLLRLARGTGVAGLAGIPARRGVVLRPLLGCGRAALAAAVAAAGLVAVDDPTNRLLATPRNRLRHGLLARDPEVGARAAALAVAAAGARAAVARRVASLAPVTCGPHGPRLALADLRPLPAELVPWALAALHAAHGLPHPPRRAAILELSRQLAAGTPPACDCAAGWSWRTDAGHLELARPSREPAAQSPSHPASPLRTTLREAGRRSAATHSFAYTLEVPGGVEISEAATTFRLTRQPVAPWMRRGSVSRAALDLPLEPGDRVTIRNRRPGDRLQPFGCAFERRLKDLLIDRKVPRQERDRLPLLCVGGQVAWVPGITVHDAFRLRPESRFAWVAELGSLLGSEE
jgi:tRNA(Ile)-lysidine synthase